MPFELTRSVRFCISFSHTQLEHAPKSGANTHAAWPSMSGLGAYYELEISCRGEPDGASGYIVNISDLDRVIRGRAIPEIQAAAATEMSLRPVGILRGVLRLIRNNQLLEITSVRWWLTPYYSITIESADMNRAVHSQQFSFSAAHRLNCADLSEAENRALFGKCNNQNGHGHNYRLDVAVSVPIDSEPFSVERLEQVVHEEVVQRLDHRHLNLDVKEFADLNPSVENIARVCHDLLLDRLQAEGMPLESVTVWETEKTRCTYTANRP